MKKQKKGLLTDCVVKYREVLGTVRVGLVSMGVLKSC